MLLSLYVSQTMPILLGYSSSLRELAANLSPFSSNLDGALGVSICITAAPSGALALKCEGRSESAFEKRSDFLPRRRLISHSQK